MIFVLFDYFGLIFVFGIDVLVFVVVSGLLVFLGMVVIVVVGLIVVL